MIFVAAFSSFCLRRRRRRRRRKRRIIKFSF